MNIGNTIAVSGPLPPHKKTPTNPIMSILCNSWTAKGTLCLRPCATGHCPTHKGCASEENCFDAEYSAELKKWLIEQNIKMNTVTQAVLGRFKAAVYPDVVSNDEAFCARFVTFLAGRKASDALIEEFVKIEQGRE